MEVLTASSFEKLGDGVYFAVVKLPQMTNAPITTEFPISETVSLGGKYAPGQTTLSYKIINRATGEAFTAAELSAKGISYTASVTANGSGTFTGKLVLTGKKSDINAFLDDGFLIQEAKLDDSNWTTDDSYWIIVNEEGQNLAAKLKTVDFEKQIFDVDTDTIAAGPSFESVYTNNEETTPVNPDGKSDGSSDSGDKGSKSNNGNSDIPKTGDESGLGFWMSTVFISGLALAGAVVAKKRNLSR